MLKIGDERTIIDTMLVSDNKWLAGQTVTILEIDNGESWEDTIVKVKTTDNQDTWMNPKDFVSQPLYPVHDKIAQALGGFRFNANDAFGGLPIIAPEDRAEPGAHSSTCYICRDPDFATRGLPLCRACPACGGHVAADDSVCDNCGLDDSDFWQLVAYAEHGHSKLNRGLTFYIKRMFFAADCEPKDPSVKELHRATVALKREIEKCQ